MKLYLLSLISFLAISLNAAELINKTVVIVNDDVILQSDIQEFKNKLKSKSFQELFGGIGEEVEKDERKVLQLLVEEKIINQQIARLELTASPQEVDGRIDAIAARNQITRAQLNSRLKQLGTSLDEYRQGIKRQIERGALIEREIKPTLEVTEEQLQHFYQQSDLARGQDTEFKIAHIFIEGNTAASRARGVTVWNEVKKAPEKFNDFVREYSDDTSTIETGGLLGFFSMDSLSEEFKKVVPKTESQQVTSPIRTAAGYHIVKVLEVRNASFKNLSKPKQEEIRTALASREVERKMRLWLERKKAESYIRFSDEKDNF